MTTLPPLVPPLSYEEILNANIERVKELLPGYTPAQGDDIMLVLQDFAYREMALREHIQQQAEGNFLMTARGAKLDHLAMTLYGMERLHGSRPYTTATMELSRPLSYRVVIPKGFELVDDGGIYHAYTTDEAVIEAGETSATVTIELDAMVSSSKVRTEIAVDQVPFLRISQNGDFANGGDEETDEEFRARIVVSLSRNSTAGSRNAYIGHTYAADERIDDVAAYRVSPGVVKVVYYSAAADSEMQQRVEEALNADDVRPITDQVVVEPASVRSVDISATLHVQAGIDPANATAEARERVAGVFASPQIGRDVTLSRLISAMSVDGVDDVTLTTPSGNVSVSIDEVAMLGSLSISTQESSDVY